MIITIKKSDMDITIEISDKEFKKKSMKKFIRELLDLKNNLKSKDQEPNDGMDVLIESEEKKNYIESDNDELFKMFWNAYPREKRDNQLKCKRIWNSINDDKKAIIDFVERAKETKRWKNGYIPFASNFLIERKYTDELEAYNYEPANNQREQGKEEVKEKEFYDYDWKERSKYLKAHPNQFIRDKNGLIQSEGKRKIIYLEGGKKYEIDLTENEIDELYAEEDGYRDEYRIAFIQKRKHRAKQLPDDEIEVVDLCYMIDGIRPEKFKLPYEKVDLTPKPGKALFTLD